MSFGVLESAQALGDARALEDAGRRLIRFYLDGDVAGELQRLISDSQFNMSVEKDRESAK